MKAIPNYPDYFAEECGAIYHRLENGDYKKITPYLWCGRYHRVQFNVDGKQQKRYVHQLILETFVGPRPSPKHVSRHLNDIGTDNRIENLAWGTCKENGADYSRNKKNGKDIDVVLVQRVYQLGFDINEIARLVRTKPGVIALLLDA